MSHFKDDRHQELYLEMMRVLENNDKYYSGFAFLASAIGKNELLKALSSKRINPSTLIRLSAAYTNAERSVLELSWQLFSGRNLYEANGEIRYSTVDDLFESLDTDNRKIVLHALRERYTTL